jgi:hypothetical protein
MKRNNEMENDKQLVTYSVTDAAIAAMEAHSLQLKVYGVDDKENYKLVNTARLEVRRHRLDVEKMRKAQKKKATDWGKAIDAEAKRITDKLEAIESYLMSQQKIVDDYEAQKKKQAEEAKALLIRQRKDAIAPYIKIPVADNFLAAMDTESFDVFLGEAIEAHEQREKERQELEQLRADALAAEREKKAQEHLAAQAAKKDPETTDLRAAISTKLPPHAFPPEAKLTTPTNIEKPKTLAPPPQMAVSVAVDKKASIDTDTELAKAKARISQLELMLREATDQLIDAGIVQPKEGRVSTFELWSNVFALCLKPQIVGPLRLGQPSPILNVIEALDKRITGGILVGQQRKVVGNTNGESAQC